MQNKNAALVLIKNPPNFKFNMCNNLFFVSVVNLNKTEKYGKTGSARSNNGHNKKRKKKKSFISGLIPACDNGQNCTVHDFLNKGANDDTFSKEDYTPLLEAFNRGHTNNIHLILKNNADINICKKDGTSSLNIARQNGHDSTVQLLLNKGQLLIHV